MYSNLLKLRSISCILHVHSYILVKMNIFGIKDYD